MHIATCIKILYISNPVVHRDFTQYILYIDNNILCETITTMRLPKCITILFMIATICNVSSYASFNSCEKIDGDCPFCKHPFLAGHNPVAKVLLSSVDELVSSAEHVEDVLKNLSSSKNIQRFDNPKTGLHTSLFYFCCHSKKDVNQIKNALQNMNWTSFIIRYNSFSCNLDHDGKTVYLHALPSNQSPLFHWASIVEQTVESYNVTINHPRKSKFHMTLARVTPEYPTDKAVELLKKFNFEETRLSSFVFENEIYHAKDCPNGHYFLGTKKKKNEDNNDSQY